MKEVLIDMEANKTLNEAWKQRIKSSGADFVYFVDISMLPTDIIEDYTCAVLFGKALSKEYISTLRAGQEPKRKEVNNTERKMDALAVKIAEQLEAEGYKSIGKLKTGRLPHKTVALRAGLGFIGKNNLLVTPRYGCAQMLGKVLTTAPFVTMSETITEPQCGDCSICVDVCPTKALLGKTWSITTTREEILVRKLCTLCLKCMVWCPHTGKYIKGIDS
jgi:epoxyqueuosine reductase